MENQMDKQKVEQFIKQMDALADDFAKLVGEITDFEARVNAQLATVLNEIGKDIVK